MRPLFTGLHKPTASIVRSLLPFERMKVDGVKTFEAEPFETFKPEGLMIWGASYYATVRHILIGAVPQLVAGIAPIPARWFASSQSYEQVWRAHREGKDPPGWGDFSIVYHGMTVKIEIEDSSFDGVQLLMWGKSLR